MATSRDYYDILGVSKSATAAEIKSAYRKLALKWHPDRNKENDAHEKFKEINEAYEVLSNPEKKAKFDQFGHAAFGNGGGFNPNGGAGNPFGSYYQAGGNINFEDLFGGAGGFSDPFDIFSGFFGGGFGGQRRPQKTHYSLKIDFDEAVHGAEKSIVHQGKEYTIKIPAGADEGTTIRYSDFDISFDVRPSKIFKREGSNVIVNHEIPFTLAILGGDTVIPTLDGELKIKVRPGTQPESAIRLTGKGVKHLRGNQHGDLYIRYVIKFPTRLSGKQKDLLKKFEAEG
ncbi:MAG TPA: J domain-containing protein [Spirochaetia bacterium]|nr:J domain-containing protein [Spirochaetia bacterium]